MKRRGHIIAIIRNRGFGFISDPDSKVNTFFHLSGLNGVTIEALNKGDEVEFEIAPGKKGPKAVNIVLAD